MANEITVGAAGGNGGDGGDDDFKELLKKLNGANEIISVTVDTVANLSKGMGILGNQIQKIAENQEKTNEDIGTVKADIDVLKDDVLLTRMQKRKLRNAVHNRVAYLLADIPEENRRPYNQTFYQRCWSDINNDLNAPTYSEIRRADCDRALELANNWEPLGGTQALKDLIDRRRRG